MSYKCNCPELANNPTTCRHPCNAGCCVNGTTWEERMATNNSNNPQYSVLGGVVAPKNAEYTMPSMSNPNAERPVKRIDTQIPSLTDLGGVGDMKNFNPYNKMGTYTNNINRMRNDQRLPKKFGGNFYTNVNLEQPSGSPILTPRGIDMGGFGGGGSPEAKKKGCRGTCKIPQGFLRRRLKDNNKKWQLIGGQI